MVKCAYQCCDNATYHKTPGLTFHRFPKNEHLRNAWIENMKLQHWQPTSSSSLCSKHFEKHLIDPSAFRTTLRPGAIPTLFNELPVAPYDKTKTRLLKSLKQESTFPWLHAAVLKYKAMVACNHRKMAPVVPEDIKMAPFVQEELKVCRVCLALDVKMYNMRDFKLSEMFQNITGIMGIDKKGSILQRICWECAARLTAAAAFREKALVSDALLNDQVDIKESDIVLLKQNYSFLKSPLSVVTSYHIDCEPIISENKEIDYNIPNVKTAIKERKTKIIMNEKDIEFEEHEPWIDVSVKTEVESDPIAVNNMQFQDRKSDKFFEHFNDTSLREDSEDDMRNTEVQINNNDEIFMGDTENKVPYINDDSIISVEDDETVDKKPKLDGFGNIVYELSSEEDRYSEEASFNNYKQNMSNRVGIKKKRATIRNNTSLKRKIIALKKKGLSVSAIAKETGTSIHSIYGLLHRYNRDLEKNKYLNAEAGNEIAACSTTVRRRVRQPGLDHILMKKPERTANMGQNISKKSPLDDPLRQRIIALKQEGMTNSRVAYLLDITRFTVRKWWNRWCKEGHTKNHKVTRKKRKTTPQDDQLLIQRVTQEQTVHTPSLAKELGISTQSIRNRLKEAGFKPLERRASVPLRSGRSHKVDEVTKEKIISMKNNGVSVTDIVINSE